MQLNKKGQRVFGACTTAQNKYKLYYKSVRAIMVGQQVRFHENWASANEHRTREQTLQTFGIHLGRQRIYQTGSGALTISGKLSEAGKVVAGQQDDFYIAFSFALYWAYGFTRGTCRKELYPDIEQYYKPIEANVCARANMSNVVHPYR